ncbi:hypothetical protein [Methanococcoides burtonii]|uniref:Uncharacterized protein n=1 Tax=Methanococcoides burtonii (strain DSM 6242 / NBRC 107633 / OCM 468 / ACE-M) TaxID=259564 RepID=Q12VI7_METBU|nr:hypothetical protein [Methanococcoides burtonii]ABE52539.1 Hypothetical protein Mbur_1637 [Methanococcoides burtonii DSM 6242]
MIQDEYIETIKTDMTYEQFIERYAALKFQKTKGYSSYVGKMIGDISPDKKNHVACSTGKIHPTKAIFILVDGKEIGVPQKTLELYNDHKIKPPRTRGSTAPSW